MENNIDCIRIEDGEEFISLILKFVEDEEYVALLDKVRNAATYNYQNGVNHKKRQHISTLYKNYKSALAEYNHERDKLGELSLHITRLLCAGIVNEYEPKNFL